MFHVYPIVFHKYLVGRCLEPQTPPQPPPLRGSKRLQTQGMTGGFWKVFGVEFNVSIYLDYIYLGCLVSFNSISACGEEIVFPSIFTKSKSMFYVVSVDFMHFMWFGYGLPGILSSNKPTTHLQRQVVEI